MRARSRQALTGGRRIGRQRDGLFLRGSILGRADESGLPILVFKGGNVMAQRLTVHRDGEAIYDIVMEPDFNGLGPEVE